MCGHRGIIQCGRCRTLGCWAETPTITCVACGSSGPVQGTIERLDATDIG
ncbi:hypothetical protein [Nocardia yunnanensis]|nr:hypothetical protein [Nocardia yunnanensis]